MDKDNYKKLNREITKKLLETQTEIEKEKILRKRHLPIADIISEYVNKDLPLLDIGAREGNLLQLLSKNGFKNLYGVDISEDAIRILTSKGLEGQVVDAQNFSLNRIFNTIILSHVLEHCPDAEKVISNAYNHLAYEGIFYVEVPRQPKIEMPTKAGHYYHYDEINDFLSLFDPIRWKLLYILYRRGENKGVIKSIFRKIQ